MTHKRTRNAKSQELARKRIIAVRGNRCEKCGYDGYIELHHIKRAVDGGSFKDENLLLLCEMCHAEVGNIKKKKFIDARRITWMPI